MTLSFNRSAERIRQASEFLAGGVSSNFRLGISPTPLVFERADGPFLHDIDGNRLIDYYLGMGPMILGHRPEAVVEAVRKQLERGILFGGQSEVEFEAAELICGLLPSAERVRFSSSGTEAVQAALVTALFLGEQLPLLAWAGIVAGVAGVLILALAGRGLTLREIAGSLGQPAALFGLGAGSMFACAAVAIKLATAELQGVDTVGSALVTLVVVMAMQSALHLAWIIARDRDTLAAVGRTWRSSAQVGLLSALGSACWYTGFAAAPAALVRVVGQVEVVFTIAFAHFYLREPVRWHETLGLLLVVGGVILALLST